MTHLGNKPLFLTLLRFACAFSVLIVPSSLHAVDFSKSAIVMFERNVMTLPEGLVQCGLDSALVSLSPIEMILQEHSVLAIALLVPGFEQADTVGTNRHGDEYQVTDWSRVYVIEVPDEADVDSLINDLQNIDGVVFAESAITEVADTDAPYAFPSPCVNDPVFRVGDQWQLQNFGLDVGGTLTPGTPDADIDLLEAWEITQGDSISVAVFDHSVWGAHDDLAGRVSGDPYVDDTVTWHATAIAGLIAANANNLTAISGVNPNARIYSRRTSQEKFLAAIADGVVGVIENDIPIVNMSYVLGANAVEQRAMRDAYNAGVLLVGTISYTTYPAEWVYPGKHDRVVAVGYTDSDDEVPDLQRTTTWIDLTAPGDGIISLDASNGWDTYGGTSFAAPLVAGVASLLLSIRPDLYNDDLAEIIIRSADDVLGTAEWDSSYGHGRLNAERALEMILFPNELYHGETEFNNQVHDTTTIANMAFASVSGAPSLVRARRYEVRREVTFPNEYSIPPEVWGRGAPTNGLNADNPNYGWRFCEVVGGSVTTTGCTLRSYVYELLDGSQRWVPNEPEDVRFAYTVVGRQEHHYRVKSYVRPRGTTSLLSMPEHWAVGCPGGDSDTLVVKVALDAQDFEEAPSKEDFTLSQPHNAKASLFPDCSTRIADYDAVLSTDPEFPNGCYKTSFSISGFGGSCGVDSVRVRFRGGLLGYVPINVRSPDMVSVSTSWAKVTLADLNTWSFFYPSPPKAYETLADFVAPTDVGFADFALFVYHYANGGHEYSSSLVAGDQPVVHGNVVVDLTDGAVVGGERTLMASVRLENVAPYEVGLLAFRCNNPRLAFIGWEKASTYGGEIICGEAKVGYDRVLAIGLVAGESVSGSFEIGIATYRVVGADSLVLDDEDFASVISDLLLVSGVEGPMSASIIHGPSARLTNSLAQNFPNPFNPQTTLRFSMKEAGHVRLTVYDVTGRLVRELVNESRGPGVYKAVWDGRNMNGSAVASGAYFYKLVAGSFSSSRKMMLLK